MSRVGPVVDAMDGEELVNLSPLEQSEPLLRTKLLIPPLRLNRVSRPRLIERINNGLDKPLILISAPAGYGKTTLVSSWLHETEIPSAWILLDEQDNDPIRFLQNLIEAINKISPAIESGLKSPLQGMGPAPYDALLHIFYNEITSRSAPFILVLDDFHVIHSQHILDLLALLLEHMPPQMHLVLLTRTDPSLPLSRLRARNQLAEIRAEQLRFSNKEIAIFLNEVMGLRLTANDIAAMEARTEGWIAGLQLAALSMLNSKDIHGFVSAFTGSHYYIMDYLMEEVLKHQPERIGLFLLKTSILTSMCASLCEAVVGMEGLGPDRGQSVLEILEQKNLFVTPLDDRRQWYRYHPLFADVLNIRLEHLFPQQLPELHRRASHWYEQNSMIHEAIQYAMMAQDQAHAAQLVEQYGCSLLMSGEGFTLLKWVEAVESYAQTHPWLAILKAWALARTGYEDQVDPSLRTAERLISSLETSLQPTIEGKIMLGSIAAARAYLSNSRGEADLAKNYAQGALKYLPDSNAFSCSLRSVATSILGDASWMTGDLENAKQAYREAVKISQTAGNIYMTIIANSNLADVLMEQGALHQAARLYLEVLQVATRPDGQMLPNADRLYAGLSEISYEWNQLDDADRYVHKCIELCRQWGNSNLLAKCYIILARLERARCNLDKAQAAMHAAEQMASEARLPARQSKWVEINAARWWLTEGDLERTAHFLQQSQVTIDCITRVAAPREATTFEVDHPYLRGSEYLLLLRLLLAQGDYEAAFSLSERLLPLATAAKRIGRVIEILVLQALALQGKKEMAEASSVLARALSLAQPEGYVRIFLDEGDSLVKFLYLAKSQRLSQGCASELQSMLGGVTRTDQPSAQHLIEPLTARELEILRLIESGDTNQDIADRLVISIPTVKRHISNINAKLGAKNRTQAVSLGRELGLLV
ncbi:MAG: hypothetical protein A2W35_21210 [Chloroflexi bacterium RBG_16_57_11]|nr:MAG: hypothetical protein A2W35_21210 [Chloroflexi bacterium RBG_16_57_11]